MDWQPAAIIKKCPRHWLSPSVGDTDFKRLAAFPDRGVPRGGFLYRHGLCPEIRYVQEEPTIGGHALAQHIPKQATAHLCESGINVQILFQQGSGK